ncbi:MULTISPECIES: hypothetical protein [unclassified Rhodococcus (in: high G+C Gram-positive bacteria)]|uniref:hypothetical protein n=1 Tax=unclassified Rhodococcus (in: high G+C Gram-positive bacteria) TaxID=192944 RepID=UPI00163A6915|nr:MULTISPECIES: hypothetical protein [unclassified Rhodococcus (in: high G+C Gram-positive bacteria)]MBC2640817.1 hypothetical protein [Rhodococcus sp. 3A]MBC2894439.1 hypothetical protein [Rhodococcus sp. 4CII]
MCYPTACTRCGKTTWGGCGRHADSVMRSVPAADRCTCTNDSTPQKKPGLLRGLFGR